MADAYVLTAEEKERALRSALALREKLTRKVTAMTDETTTEDELGQPADCEQCGYPGEWVIDPYALEIAGVRVVTALCDRCYAGRAQDI